MTASRYDYLYKRMRTNFEYAKYVTSVYVPKDASGFTDAKVGKMLSESAHVNQGLVTWSC